MKIPTIEEGLKLSTICQTADDYAKKGLYEGEDLYVSQDHITTKLQISRLHYIEENNLKPIYKAHGRNSLSSLQA